MKRTVFFISDSTGITAEALGSSLLSQFEDIEFERIALRFIKTPEQAEEVVRRINEAGAKDGQRPIVFDTIVRPEVREIIAHSDGFVIDFLKSFIGKLEEELQAQSTLSVGRSHTIDEQGRYFSRIDAVNYALSHDDGVGTEGYGRSDLILVGVSRCGKTPTSLYLALQFGVKVANYPFTPEDLESMRLHPALKRHKSRLFGLTIDPERLHEIRSERRAGSQYASRRQCQLEVRDVEALYRREGIPHISTTRRSVEEIAATIMTEAGIQQRN
ncbi:MAG TPA: pyruvate, water dikinase regulatory protein [Acidobacteriota bacterium]|nr:pyruvate, water dikinase regulatory protein [Acidobacteriota bacterium]